MASSILDYTALSNRLRKSRAVNGAAPGFGSRPQDRDPGDRVATCAEVEIGPGCRASVTPSGILLAKGRYYLACRNEDPLATAGTAVRELGGRISDRLAGEFPSGIFSPIQAGNPVPGSQIAVVFPISLGVRPWLAFLGKKGFERGWLAAYQTATGTVEALLAEYKSPELALDAIAGTSAGSNAGIKAESRGRRAVIVQVASATGPGVDALVKSLLGQ